TPTPDERSYNMENARVFATLPKAALLGLGDVDLSRFSWSYYDVAPLLVARHGLEVLDFVLRVAEVDAPQAVRALRRVNSPRVAPLMADALVRLKKVRQEATDWLVAFPEAAAAGLIPYALGRPGKTHDAACTALQLVAGRGKRANVEAIADRYG